MHSSIRSTLSVLTTGVLSAFSAFAELPDSFVEFVGTESTFVKTGLCPGCDY